MISHFIYYASILAAFLILSFDKLLGGFSAFVFVFTSLLIYYAVNREYYITGYIFSAIICFFLCTFLMFSINASLLSSGVIGKIKNGIVIVQNGEITNYARSGILKSVALSSALIAAGRLFIVISAYTGRRSSPSD